MDFSKLKTGFPLETKDGPGTFLRYKQNANKQNVYVQLIGKKEGKWFKEKHIEEPEKTKPKIETIVLPSKLNNTIVRQSKMNDSNE